MPAYQINTDEEFAMKGLPHTARLVYTYLRQHMDFATGITGIKRKVSLQGISEYLYVEPHQGIKEETYSHMQVRGALNWLEKAGLIERDKSKNRANKQSVFKLILATRDKSAQNKVIRGTTVKVIKGTTELTPNNTNDYSCIESSEVNSTKSNKVNNPPLSDIYTTSSIGDSRQKITMHLEWLPEPKKLKMLQLNAGIPNIQIPIDYIQEFRGFWSGRADLEKTEHEWIHMLVTKFKYSYERGRANANSSQSYRKYSKNTQSIDLDKMANEEF